MDNDKIRTSWPKMQKLLLLNAFIRFYTGKCCRKLPFVLVENTRNCLTSSVFTSDALRYLIKQQTFNFLASLSLCNNNQLDDGRTRRASYEAIEDGSCLVIVYFVCHRPCSPNSNELVILVVVLPNLSFCCY